MAVQYFQIGFNKCGTTSIARFFQRIGMDAIHWDGGRLARRMRDNLTHGKYILSGYEDYRAYCDMESLVPGEFIEGYKYFDEIANQVPDPMFILNTRDPGRWINSRLSHMGGEYAELQRRALGLPKLSNLVEYWHEDRVRHHDRVKRLVSSDRLLVFDVERDSPSKLCDFVGVPHAASRHFVVEKSTSSRLGDLLSQGIPDGVKSRFSLETRKRVRRLLRRRGLLR